MSTTLLSLSFLMPTLWLGYTLRARWNARQDWSSYSADTKAFFLLVAPPIMFALDLVMITDRLFYSARFDDGGRILAAVVLLTASVGQSFASETAPSLDPTTISLEQAVSKPVPERLYLTPAEASALQTREPASAYPDSSADDCKCR